MIWPNRPPLKTHRSRRLTQRLALEVLEERTLLSTCVVNRLTDTGAGRRSFGDLRYCINRANNLQGPDAITFAVTGTILLSMALPPPLGSDIDLQGPGAQLLTVRRHTGGDYRIFSVSPGATVAIFGLTITNGNLNASGGGIHNQGALIVDASIIVNNSAVNGGGIYNGAGGVLAVRHSTVFGNLAYWNGSAYGGGIYNHADSIGMTIENSTISGNTVLGSGVDRGGGIANDGSVTISNSTICDNVADSVETGGDPQGGGIWNHGSLLVVNSTIARNTAEDSGRGGGVDSGSGSNKAYLHNTIVALNQAFKGPDFKGLLTSSGYNIFGNSGYVYGYTETDILDVDPLLGPLQDNGGPTQTIALLPGSPAIDSGDNTDAPQWDQRGPGFPRIVNAVIDRGSFEVQATGTPVFGPAALGLALIGVGARPQPVAVPGISITADGVAEKPVAKGLLEAWPSSAAENGHGTVALATARYTPDSVFADAFGEHLAPELGSI
jgi:hypothetical protein